MKTSVECKKMLDQEAIIMGNDPLAEDIYKMVLSMDVAEEMTPGQFLNIKLQGKMLRRPISISAYNREKQEVILVYKIVGEGTNELAHMKIGETLMVLGPLGTGFPIHEDIGSALLIGGGVGIPPLLQTAKELLAEGVRVVAALGYPTKNAVYYEEEFHDLGVQVHVTTDDGSYGYHGNVLDLIENKELTGEYVYACGPLGMLKGIEEKFEKGYLSFEARMACGIGACMACVCKDKKEETIYYRICKEGPVFEIGKVEW